MNKLLFISLLMLSGTLRAQQAMRLNDCIEYAYTNNAQMKLAQLQIADAEWQIKERKSTGLPQATANIAYSAFLQRAGIPASAVSFGGGGAPPPNDLVQAFDDRGLGGFFPWIGSAFSPDPNGKLVFAPVHSLSGTIQASQLIFSSSYLVALKAANYYRDYVNGQIALTKQTLRNQVTDTYLPALLISDNVAVLDKNIGNLEKLLTETKAINQAGFAEQLDVDRLELSIATLRSERGNLLRQQEIVVDALKLTMGMPVGQAVTISDNVEKLMTEIAEADLTTQLNFMNRPEYVQLLKGRELNALQVELYNKPLLPTVSGFVQYQPGFQGGFGNRSDDNFNKWYFIPSALAGISVNFTLWDSGGNKARKERALIAVQNIEAQKSVLENALTLELATARKQYLNARERVNSQQKNVALAQRIYDTTQTKYKSGIGSSFEVVQSESGLYAAQQALMTARYDLLTARVAVKRALGGQ